MLRGLDIGSDIGFFSAYVRLCISDFQVSFHGLAFVLVTFFCIACIVF